MRKPSKRMILALGLLIAIALLGSTVIVLLTPSDENPRVTDLNLRRIKRGMAVEEVEAILGRASRIEFSEKISLFNVVSEYRYYDGKRVSDLQRWRISIQCVEGRVRGARYRLEFDPTRPREVLIWVEEKLGL